MTDNGNAYRSHDFRAACTSAGARHLRTRPYTPRTNGKAERFLQTVMRECAYARAFRSSGERAAALPAGCTSITCTRRIPPLPDNRRSADSS
jgi:transposase InsO family protein